LGVEKDTQKLAADSRHQVLEEVLILSLGISKLEKGKTFKEEELLTLGPRHQFLQRRLALLHKRRADSWL